MMLVSGPAIAMRNSARAVRGSRAIWATPPKMNIPVTSDQATSAKTTSQV